MYSYKIQNYLVCPSEFIKELADKGPGNFCACGQGVGLQIFLPGVGTASLAKTQAHRRHTQGQWNIAVGAAGSTVCGVRYELYRGESL